MQHSGQEHGFTVSFEDTSAARATAPDGGPNTGPATPRPFGRRRRNRHGRGMRGPVLDAGLPASRTRAEQFEDLVVDSASRLRELWGVRLDNVEYLVEEVPDKLEEIIASGAQAPLGKATPGTKARGDSPATAPVIVIYRHPVAALCDSPWQVRELVHEVLIEQVANLLNIDPDTVDPLFRRFRHGH